MCTYWNFLKCTNITLIPISNRPKTPFVHVRELSLCPFKNLIRTKCINVRIIWFTNFAESGNSILTKHFQFFVFQVKFRGCKCHYGKEVNPVPEPYRIEIRKATIYLEWIWNKHTFRSAFWKMNRVIRHMPAFFILLQVQRHSRVTCGM